MRGCWLLAACLLLFVACGGEGETPVTPPAPAPGPVPAPIDSDPVVPAPPDDGPDEPGIDVSALEQTGFDRLREGDTTGARESFAAVLEADPDSPVAHRHLAAIEIALGGRERAELHVLKAITLSDRALGRAADVQDGRPYADFAVDLWLAGKGLEPDETRLLEEALEADPTNPRAAMILAEMNLTREDGAEALRILERAGRSLATTENGAALLLRLAVQQLAAGKLDAFAETIRRIPRNTKAHRLAQRLGEATEAGADRVKGWPRSRPGAPVPGSSDATVRTAADLDPVSAIRSGVPLLVTRLVPGRLVPELRRVVVYGYLPGLDAFLTDDLTLREPVVIPAAEVREGLIRPLGKVADPSPGQAGPVIATALAALEDGKVGVALDGVAGLPDHPLVRYVRARIAIVRSAGTDAVEAVLAGAEAPPEGPAWALLYAEALLVKGEVGRALAVLSDKSGYDFTDHPLRRRIAALATMETEDDTEAVAGLQALTRDVPDYVPAWEDLAGLHLAAERFVQGRAVLVALAEANPEFARLPRYDNARRRAAAGLILRGKTAAEFELLDSTDAVEIRRVAVKAVARLHPAETRKALLHFLQDPDRAIRVVALRLVAKQPWDGAKETVRPLLEDADELVRGAAVQSWALIGKREVTGDLCRFLGDPSPYVREVAVTGLRDMIGKRFGYDPRGPEDERTAAAGRWAKYVEQLE